MKTLHQIFFIKNGTSVYINKNEPVKKIVSGFKMSISSKGAEISYKIDGKYINLNKIYSSELSAQYSKSSLMEAIRSEKIFKYGEVFVFLRNYKEMVSFKLDDVNFM